MLFKEHFKLRLYLVNGEYPFMEGRQNGDQHIGVMLDLVQVEIVFVISGVQGLIIVQLILKLRLHSKVGRLRCQHIGIFGEVGGSEHTADPAARHHGTGGYPAEQQGDAGADPHHQQDHLAVLLDEQDRFFCRLLRLDRGAFCGGGGILRFLFRVPYLLCVVALDTFLLQIPGDRVGGRQRRIVMERLLVKELRIGLDCRLFRLCRVPPGLHAVVTDGGPGLAPGIGHAALRQFLTLMACLHTHIFLLHLVDLIVGGKADLLDRTGKGVLPQLSVGTLLHFLKSQAGFTPAGRFIKDTLCFQDLLCGDGLLCGIQLIRRLVGAPDIFLQCRISTFFLGELQTGGRAFPCRRSLPDGFRLRLCLLLCGPSGACLGDMPRRSLGGGSRFLPAGKVRFRVPAADMFCFARGKVFRHSAVTGHFLRDLIRGFQLLHVSSPAFP